MLRTKTKRMQSSSENLRRFPFTNQNFRKFGKSSKWYRSDFRKSVQKFRKLVNFLNAKHSTPKNLDIPLAKLNGKKTSVKKTFEKLGIPRELSYVLEILENAVPSAMFATGNCLKFKPDVLDEWKF